MAVTAAVEPEVTFRTVTMGWPGQPSRPGDALMPWGQSVQSAR
ncbi:MAG: hypothetical protein ACLRWQ_04870 [Flavonifractor plautii]